MTYPDPRVARTLNDETAAAKSHFADDGEVRDRYGVIWTPTLVIADGDGQALQRVSPASLPPTEFVPVLLASLGRAHLALRRTDAAIQRFDRVVADWPYALAAAEALYWRGVAHYRKNDKDAMQRDWAELSAKHPRSFWAQAITFVVRK